MRTRLGLQELIILTRQISAALKMNLPLHGAFQTEADQAPWRLRPILSALADDLKKGEPLATVLARYPRYFPDYYRDTVAAGEKAGTLAQVLDLLATQLEQSGETRMKRLTAFIYPVILLVLLFLDASFLLVFVVPKHAQIYEVFGRPLPQATRTLVNVGSVVMHHTPWVVGSFGLLALAVVFLISSRSILVHRLYWSMPFFNRYARSRETAHLCRTLRMLLSAGLALPEALRVASSMAINTYAGKLLSDAARQVERGEQLSTALKGQFAEALPWMVAATEKRGDLLQSLEPIALFYDDETQGMAETMRQVLEPVLMLAVAVVVGLFVLAAYMPIFDLPNAFQKIG